MNKTCIKIGAALLASGLLAEVAVGPAFSNVLPRWSFLPAPAVDIMAVPRLSLNGWIANFHPGAATQALKNDSQHINELSLFSVGATRDGRLAPETDFINAALRITKGMAKRPQVLLTVANIRPNQMHDRWLLDRWLGNQERWMRHSQDLIKLAETVDGLDLDYENLRPSDAPRFEQFIAYLGNALHQRGKFLSVTVEHQSFTDGRIHWDRISPYVDRIRIMAYHYHYEKTGPGAISPPKIVAQLAKDALSQVPADKLEIALPLYGFDWSRGGRTRLVPTLEKYRQLARRKAAHAFRDPRTQSARVTYSTMEKVGKYKRQVRHQVWFEDPESVSHKVKMLQNLGIVHIGFWQLGAGNVSELFDLVKKTPALSVAK